MKTEFEKINPPKENGYPRVNELVAEVVFKTNAKEPDFDKPLSELEKEY